MERYKQKDKVFFYEFLLVFRRYETQDHSTRTPENVYILNGRYEREDFIKYPIFRGKKRGGGGKKNAVTILYVNSCQLKSIVPKFCK